MNKKNFVLVGLLLVLAVIYVVAFTDWFRPQTIHISYTSRPIRFVARGQQPADTLIFGLGQDYELTEIKVVPLAALQTNQFAQPLWHLVGDPASPAINHFIYGQRIKGLAPAVKGSRPEPLQPGVTYRLFVAAGSVKGWRDFQTGVASGNSPTKR